MEVLERLGGADGDVDRRLLGVGDADARGLLVGELDLEVAEEAPRVATGTASSGSSIECSQMKALSSERASSAQRVPPRPMRPLGNSITASAGTSRRPKRVLWRVTAMDIIT